ncbi:aspartic proteinase Asp1-like protein [Cinnamomum micranthum f. kanehirae]|uniref:Aspartic proteinase Asp1-like protein n=1 Tax=Cinnamomum micranthum f. kanehirae TaxID=337451 RepID=A0A443PHK2_9MAGN|nr:aspartic proteinase Asp1-like protein [Cinnamomum micranthum f. kanehirae]
MANKQSCFVVAASASASASASVHLSGLFYVTLYIGNPPKPYYLDVDTGSDLTWVQCDAPCRNCFPGPHQLYKPKKEKLVYCEDPLCTSIHTIRKHTCGSPHEQCDYLIAYADQGSSLGVLVKDAFNLSFANGSLLQPHLAFGCGYDQQVPSINSPAPTDGVLGLGYGKSTIISQLQDFGLTRNVIGHCFSGQGGGYLFFGDSLVPYSSVTWTPMIRNPSLKYYSPGSANLLFGNQPMDLKGLQVVFDSGSSYTYFVTQAYEAFIYASKGNVCLGILNGSEVGLGNLNVIGDISMQDLMVIYDNKKQQIGWVHADCNRLPKSGTALM